MKEHFRHGSEAEQRLWMRVHLSRSKQGGQSDGCRVSPRGIRCKGGGLDPTVPCIGKMDFSYYSKNGTFVIGMLDLLD